MRFYHFIVGLVALGLAGCAAYFSVVGIATFFGTNFIQTAIAAGFLEAGKLVCASAAYRYRDLVQGWTNKLLIFFTVVMMFITSLGVFGFLSQSYQTASAQRRISEQEVENVRSQKQTLQSRVERLQSNRESLVESRNDLRDLRSEQGWLSERSAERLQQIPQELRSTDSSITQTRDEILELENKITELEARNSKSSKLGPIMFVADSVGLDPDRAALYFILTIIFVFDPMAVTLVVSLSMATDIDEAQAEEDGDSSTNHVKVPVDNDEPSSLDVAEEVDKPLPDDEGWNYGEEMEDRLGHEPLVSSLYENEEESTGEEGTKIPQQSIKHVPPPYSASDIRENIDSSSSESEDFRKNVDEFVEEEEDKDEFEEWLEGSEDDDDAPDFPDVESAFKKPFRDF